LNLDVICREANNVGESLNLKGSFPKPTLFIKGGNSNYITKDDELLIDSLFTDSTVVTVDNSGHWVHAEQPEDFLNKVLQFLEQG